MSKNNKTCGECRYFENGKCCFFHNTLVCTKIMHHIKPKQTVFEHITASPEVLAEKLVYYDSNFHVFYSTLDRLAIGYQSETGAIAATLARLKEVEK